MSSTKSAIFLFLPNKGQGPNSDVLRSKNLISVRGHTLITLAHKGTQLVSKSGQNANLVN